MRGSWYTCDGGEYAEFHFKENYFQYCFDLNPFGIIFPMKIMGDSLIHINIHGNEIVKRQLQVINDSTVLISSDLANEYEPLTLHRLPHLIEVPDVKSQDVILNKYEEFYQLREELNCR